MYKSRVFKKNRGGNKILSYPINDLEKTKTGAAGRPWAKRQRPPRG
jgi:hypothetical protein